MEVVKVADPADWLERAYPLLLADEARHNLILGIAGTLRDHPALYPDFGLWLVEDTGEVTGAALRTRPYNLVLAQGPDSAVELLAHSLDEELPGVVGALPEVDRFVAARDGTAEARSQQGIYALREVIPPRPAPGSARPASAADRELLLRWWREFTVEALGDAEPDRERLERSLDYRLETSEGGIALWEDEGRTVCAVGFGSPTPNGVRIGPVYTPQELRGRGYASALTAHVSAEQLAAGRSFCFLYTDLANPTSNKIYVALGYERVCDSVEVRVRLNRPTSARDMWGPGPDNVREGHVGSWPRQVPNVHVPASRVRGLSPDRSEAASSTWRIFGRNLGCTLPASGKSRSMPRRTSLSRFLLRGVLIAATLFVLLFALLALLWYHALPEGIFE